MTRLRSTKTVVVAVAIYFTILGPYAFFAVRALNVRRQAIQSSPTVYITRTGKKYHRLSHYGKDRSIATSLYEAVEQGYGACLVCEPPRLEVQILPWYYTRWPWIVGLLTAGFAVMLLSPKRTTRAV